MKIYFHLDFDAFFASIEEIDNPTIQNKPVVVGGSGNAGVVCAANYISKSYGVNSAMPIFKAKKLLPNNAVYISPRLNRYEEISRQIFNYIKTKYCRNITLYSIDECWLEFFSNDKKWESKFLSKAKTIQDDIFSTYKLSLSIGIGRTKFIAKMASDLKKPYGLSIIKNQEDFKFYFWNKPIYKMFMIGKSISKKLNNIGINTIGDLANFKDLVILKNIFGKNYKDYIYNANGFIYEINHIDEEEQKSFSIKRTFISYISQDDALKYVSLLAKELYRCIHNVRARFKKITCIIEFKDKTLKRYLDFDLGIYQKQDLINYSYSLFDEIFSSYSYPIRSLCFILNKIIYIDFEQQLKVNDLDSLDEKTKNNLNWQSKVKNIINTNMNNKDLVNEFMNNKKDKMHFRH